MSEMCERQHGVCEPADSDGAQMGERRPAGGQTARQCAPKPSRPAERGWSRDMRSPTKSARLQVKPVSRRESFLSAKAWRGCAESQSPTACAKSPYPTNLRAAGCQGFVAGSTTHRAPSPGFSRFGQLAKLGSTSHPSTRTSHRGRGWMGGWDMGAVSAAENRSLYLTRDGSDWS